MTGVDCTKYVLKISGILVILALVFVPFLASAQQTTPYPYQITTPPTAITTFANNINVSSTANGNSAYLNGQINPNGLQTFYWFEYGSTQNLGYKTQEVTMSYNSQLSNVFVNVVGLPYGTSYFRAAARSNAGVSYGSIKSFTIESYTNPSGSGPGTLKESPLAVTLQPSQVNSKSNTAYFNGQVNPRGQYTIAWFEYGQTTFLGLRTGQQVVGSGRSLVDVNFFVLGLRPGTNYYRVVAQNDSGTVRGSIVSITITSQGSDSLGNTGSNGGTSGGQYVYTPSGSGQSNGSLDGSNSTSDSDSDTTSGANGNLGFNSTGDPNDQFFPKVAGSSTADESDPSLFAIFTKPVATGKDDTAAVVTANTLEGDAGQRFRYVAIFRNDSFASIGSVGLKVTLPYQVQFVRSNIEPTETKYGFLSFDIGSLRIGEQKELIIETDINPDVPAGTHLVFSSTLVYTGKDGIEHAVTSYSVFKVLESTMGKTERNFLIALLGPISSFGNLLWLAIFVLLILAIFLIYRYRKNSKVILANLDNSGNGRLTYIPVKKEKSTVPANLPGVPAVSVTGPLKYKPYGQNSAGYGDREINGGKDKLVLAFSFGHRGQEPGWSNEYMARAIRDQYPDALISTQWEIGDALMRLGVPADQRIEENLNKPGKYLDTDEVARQMRDFIISQNRDLDIFAIAQDDHMPRVIKTLKKFGIDAKIGCLDIPYDPFSHQIWTRSRALFMLREILALPFYWAKGLI